jgi:hypothetical protein
MQKRTKVRQSRAEKTPAFFPTTGEIKLSMFLIGLDKERKSARNWVKTL